LEAQLCGNEKKMQRRFFRAKQFFTPVIAAMWALLWLTAEG
jgi:hypothetical protein